MSSPGNGRATGLSPGGKGRCGGLPSGGRGLLLLQVPLPHQGLSSSVCSDIGVWSVGRRSAFPPEGGGVVWLGGRVGSRTPKW
eukprot:scaffold2117_cov175-Ochromonas_danica.AAC.2